MAYLDLATTPMATGGTVAGSVVGALDRREWEIVRLARHDRIASLGAPGLLARLGAWLFGFDLRHQLADPRLEALRRFAVPAWHYGYALPVSAVREFKAAGFSMDQLETVLARIASARVDPKERAVR